MPLACGGNCLDLSSSLASFSLLFSSLRSTGFPGTTSSLNYLHWNLVSGSASGGIQTKTTQPSKALGEEEDTLCQKTENGNVHTFPSFSPQRPPMDTDGSKSIPLTILLSYSSPSKSLPLEKKGLMVSGVIQLLPSEACFRLPALPPIRKPTPGCPCSCYHLGDLLQVSVSASLSDSQALGRMYGSNLMLKG